MLGRALAALQQRSRNSSSKREKKSSAVKPLSAPSKFKLRLKRKGGGEFGVAAAAAAAEPASLSSPSSTSPMPARLSALACSASQLFLLAAQVASLLFSYYVAAVRLALDLPLSLSLTILRNAAARFFFESRPVAAAAAAASKAATRLPLLLLPAYKKPIQQQPGCVFYECKLHHARLRPARHEFEYGVRMALLDLDAPPLWFSKMVSKKSKKVHLSAAEARRAAGLPASSKPGPVWLLTMPPAAGYSQNPISVYYCYSAAAGEVEEKEERSSNDDFRMPPARNPVAAVAEVTNTPWGSVARFSFDPSGDTVPKCLHVSPFMDMKNEWRLTAPGPNERLALSVAACHPELGNFFSAALVGRIDDRPRTRSCLAERSGSLETFFNYSYGPQRVALWIYGHAAVLFFRKKLSIFGPPELGAGAKRVAAAEESESSGGSSKNKRQRRGSNNGGSSLSSSSSSSSSNNSRWHEWIAAKEWPWRVGACGI